MHVFVPADRKTRRGVACDLPESSSFSRDESETIPFSRDSSIFSAMTINGHHMTIRVEERVKIFGLLPVTVRKRPSAQDAARHFTYGDLPPHAGDIKPRPMMLER